MNILLNGQTLAIEGLEPEVTVLQLLDTVEESLKGTGATIVEIILDGQSFSPDENEKIEELKVLSFKKIEFVAATIQEMVAAAFEDGEEGLQHLEEIALEVAADLRLGRVKEAMDSYLEFVDGIEWFITMLKNAEKAFAGNMTESSVEADRQTVMTRLSEQMSSVQAAQEAEDWVGMADVLEYEFPEVLREGKVLVKKILGS
ncbi:MAG: hypothetical protein EOM80_03005 [Erysipelotrichia bacterium]|nr:hypothetical protein [Candidatus Riflebacteria bacterium]NCB37717.1 hypothetical protein [Erysipelotrichia bacterium]